VNTDVLRLILALVIVAVAWVLTLTGRWPLAATLLGSAIYLHLAIGLP
jgi:hypothetical protein